MGEARRERSGGAGVAGDERLDLIARATRDVIRDRDVRTDAVWWSEGLTVFGYRRDEVPPTWAWWEGRLHPDDRQRILPELRGCEEAGREVWSGEYRFRRADGSYADVLDRVAIRYDERGAAVRMVGAMRFGSGAGRAAEAARESEERFRTLIEHTTDLISVLARDGTALYESPSCRHLLGYAPEELVGRRVMEFVHPEDRHRLVPVFGEAFGRDELTEPITYRFRHADGRWLVLESVGRRLDDPSFGGPAALINTRDVTERKRAEEALRESEERFRQLTENIREVFWIATPDMGRMLYVSPAYEEIWGGTAASLYEDPASFTEAIHPEDRARASEVIARASVSGFDIEYRVVRPDGSVRWVQQSCFPVKDEAGRVYRLVGVSKDITAQKEAEWALQASEARLRALFEATPVGIALVDAEGRAIECSPELERILGYDTEELRGMSFTEVTHPQDVETDAALARELIEGRRDHYRLDKRYIRKDGRVIWGRLTVNRVRDGERGRFVALVEDVTERREAEERLKRISKAVEFAGDAIGIADADGQAVYLNDTATELFGYTVEELNEAGGLAALYGDPAAAGEVFANISLGKSWSGQAEVATRGGAKIPVHLSADAVKDESGQIIGFVAIWTDVRERLRLEESLWQAQKMEAVGQLAGGVAHDFNNLLTAITGYADLSLAKMRAGHPLRPYLEEINSAAERAADLTRQLLAFSRRQMLRPEPLRLDEVVAGMSEMLRRLIDERIELTVSVRPPLPHVEADRRQLELVIMNLAVNARDAMPGGGQLMISSYAEELAAPDPARPHMPTGAYAVLEVEDTGHGMDAETRRHIFEPFFTTKGVGEGTGLGLATVYGIVKQSGGYIYVESEVGAGTKFRVYLPPVAAATLQAPEEPAYVALPAGSETILLVEDEEMVRTPIRMILAGLGYRVLEAARAKEAVAQCEQFGGRIDLLLTDMVMPHVGGKELAATLTALRPEMRVLFMSGYTPDESLRNGARGAAPPFLPKPFTTRQLAVKVREVLDRS